jgi:hypothetical protein
MQLVALDFKHRVHLVNWLSIHQLSQLLGFAGTVMENHNKLLGEGNIIKQGERTISVYQQCSLYGIFCPVLLG